MVSFIAGFVGIGLLRQGWVKERSAAGEKRGELERTPDT
jgi:hypothetical protein